MKKNQSTLSKGYVAKMFVCVSLLLFGGVTLEKMVCMRQIICSAFTKRIWSMLYMDVN